MLGPSRQPGRVVAAGSYDDAGLAGDAGLPTDRADARQPRHHPRAASDSCELLEEVSTSAGHLPGDRGSKASNIARDEGKSRLYGCPMRFAQALHLPNSLAAPAPSTLPRPPQLRRPPLL
jgi:hypothetical protein